MMRQYELVERVLNYDASADEAMLNRAYVYAMKAHGQQTRASGDPYFSHPLEVAAILTDMRLDAATIATALLHDVIEDTDATRAEIDQLFGAEIGALVDGLTKIKKLDLVSKKTEQAENFRKLLIAISSDIRVLLVKLADRLHNMRTLEHMKPGSRKRISEETLEIYAPLAGRMGMQAMRDELEDLAFRWLHPEAHETVTEKLNELRQHNEGLVAEIRFELEAKLAEVGIKARVEGREKKVYSIWSKMANKQISLEQLSDIYGFRIIVGDVGSCYRALGIVHTTWSTVPGRFKDYISTPKQNGYQSLHTTVVGPRHQRVELQIRTEDMHNVAEYGVASHAFYKDLSLIKANGSNGSAKRTGNGGAVLLDKDCGPYLWLRRLVETLLEGSNSEEFLEHTKLELFQDQVFCFTPKGRLIALPHGATPLDFAYAVHTDVGNAAVGANINGRHMPIDTELRNGDEVEVLTSPTHTPPPAWESFAVTGRARSAIRRAARDALRRQYCELGRRLLTHAFEEVGETYSDGILEEVLPKLGAGQKSLEDVLASVGRNEIKISNILRACLPPELIKDGVQGRSQKNRYVYGQTVEGWFNLPKSIGLKFRFRSGQSDAADGGSSGRSGGVPIRGLAQDIPVSFEGGGAVPGDRIVGVLIPNEGIRIFHVGSKRLREFERDRWIDVAWDVPENGAERFPATISVTALNEPGTLGQIAQLIGEGDGNIDHLRMLSRGPKFTEMLIEIEVWDVSHLNNIITGLMSQGVVSGVKRVFE